MPVIYTFINTKKNCNLNQDLDANFNLKLNRIRTFHYTTYAIRELQIITSDSSMSITVAVNQRLKLEDN